MRGEALLDGVGGVVAKHVSVAEIARPASQGQAPVEAAVTVEQRNALHRLASPAILVP